LFDGRRPILLDGVILEQGPMDAPHANGVERTDMAVRQAFGAGWRFRIQLPLVLSEFSDPMPDLAVRRDGLQDSSDAQSWRHRLTTRRAGFDHSHF
jgi:hypothetical protein